ncbi:MAG: hypothetical protein U1E45_05850 [Geminicoccaceae bacterium]
MTTALDPAELVALADTMLPGDDLFPAASLVGAHGVLAQRLRTLGVLERLAPALAAAGAPLARLDEGARETVARRLEQNEPELFAAVRLALYTGYYEQPAVIEAIRALGFTYNDAPLPEGYALEPFDIEADLPQHGRGHWVPTDEVGGRP